MAYNYEGPNSLVTLITLIKNKTEEIKNAIPQIDTSFNESSGNAASSAAVSTYVKGLISAVSSISFKKVEVLPESGESSYIYLLPKSSSAAGNIYDEYIWIEGAWELIGSTAMSLDGYVKAEDMHELTAEEITEIFNAVWGA